MLRVPRSVFFIGVCVAGSWAPLACSSSDAPVATPATTSANPDVVYEPHGSTIFSPAANGITDEAVEAILAKAPTTGGPNAATITDPKAGAELAAATPATFKWILGAAPVEDAGTDAPTGLLVAPRPRAVPRLALFGEGAAWAHGGAFSGTGYVLVFSTSKDAKLVRAATALSSYTPHPESWKKLVAAGEPISLVVLNAQMSENAVKDGPFACAAITFTVK
jgi:hypothetical protein